MRKGCTFRSRGKELAGHEAYGNMQQCVGRCAYILQSVSGHCHCWHERGMAWSYHSLLRGAHTRWVRNTVPPLACSCVWCLCFVSVTCVFSQVKAWGTAVPYLVLTLHSVVWLSQWSEGHEEWLGSGGHLVPTESMPWPYSRGFGLNKDVLGTITSAAGPAIVWRDTYLPFTMAFTSLWLYDVYLDWELFL